MLPSNYYPPAGAALVQVVRQLVAQVEEASAAMLNALLTRLRGNIQLPDCLRVVGYLRRLPAFPEPVSTHSYSENCQVQTTAYWLQIACNSLQAFGKQI